MPLFSIATPCFNSEKTIERTIKSILAQDYKDYEYIIVDGGSTDGTIEIIRKYASLFEGRMSWKSERDKGLYDAFNKGVARSNGTYCWNVNSDDYLESDALSYFASIIEKYDSKDLPVISAALNFIDERTGKSLYVERTSEEHANMVRKFDYAGIAHPATIVPKAVYDKWGTFDDRYKLLADTEWCLRMYRHYVPFVYVDKVVINMSNGGLTGNMGWKRFKINRKDRKLFFKEYYKNPIERYARLLFWDLDFLRVAMKNVIKQQK